MDQKKEYWEVEPEPDEVNDIEPELFEELNQSDEHKNEETTKHHSSGTGKKMVAIITAAIFLVFIGGNVLRFTNMPDLGFLAESFQLRQGSEIQELQEAVVTIRNNQSGGTGFNISEEGLIITNEHVIRDGDNILVQFSSGESFRGDPVVVIPELDLAVLEVDGNELPTLTLGSSANISNEDQVLIIGNPLGISRVVKKGNIIGMGEVSGISEEVILIQGPIHKGSSGSPVFNENEEVIAVIFAVLVSEQTESEEIVGLAIPIDLIKSKIEQKDEGE